jgi:uncharacterized membrane protein
MQSKVRIVRHPTHPILIVFPTAMFPLLVLLDVLRYVYPADLAFWTIGFWVALVGAITTLVAAVPGIVDLAAIPNESRAHRTAFVHFGVGVATLILYAVAVLVRWPPGGDDARFGWAVLVDVLGLVAIGAQGWLGGELVYKHHIGVLSPAEGADPVTLETGSPSQAPPGARAGARRPGAERP